jgi:tight adherence protein B
MNGIPFGMILYIDFTSPGFFDIMYGTWMGRLIMTLCLAFYMGAVMLSGKILDIEI